MNDMAASLEERLVRYVQVDTQSDERSSSTPSTAKQFDLLRMLEQELQAMGASDVRLDEQGFLLASVPATLPEAGPRIAFLAHVDTVPGFSGADVRPLVHRRYEGQPIVLPDDPSQVLSPEAFPYLAEKIGDDIITASGTTLLGADDKSGVAVIMTLAEQLLQNPQIGHGEVRLCFTPDEESGIL